VAPLLLLGQGMHLNFGLEAGLKDIFILGVDHLTPAEKGEHRAHLDCKGKVGATVEPALADAFRPRPRWVPGKLVGAMCHA